MQQTHPDWLCELLAGYAAGTLSRPLHTLVAGQLELSPAHRTFVAQLEATRGAQLQGQEPAPLVSRDARLQDIFASACPAPSMVPASSICPHSIEAYLGHSWQDVRWRRLMPGIKEYRIQENEGLAVSMVWTSAGMSIPDHGHDGDEYTLVLTGGFTDNSGAYSRGDISYVDSAFSHNPVIMNDSDCVAFIVSSGQNVFSNPLLRLVQRFF